jgi:hypothetical protein
MLPFEICYRRALIGMIGNHQSEPARALHDGPFHAIFLFTALQFRKRGLAVNKLRQHQIRPSLRRGLFI